MTFSVRRIDHVVLTCRDVAATADWYVRALGMEVQSYAAGRTALVFGQQKLNLRPLGAAGWETAAVDTPGAIDICFETTSGIEEVLAAWGAAGISVHDGPVARSGARGPITSVYALDPDGNLVEVAHYAG